MTNIKDLAMELYQRGYSCSEAIVKASQDAKFIDKNIPTDLLLQIATPFSGGMSSGCVCGAVAGAEIVLGLTLGNKNQPSSRKIRTLSKNFVDKFKEKRKTICCRALSAGFDFKSPERKMNCLNIVGECAEILEEIIRENSNSLINI